MSIYNKDNHWSLYIGVMTETTSYRNQRKFNIYVSELAPFAEGDIQPELFENKFELENVYTGQKEQGKVTVSKNIIADYFGLTSSLDVPTMYKGQQVLVLNYGHNDRWYWIPLERDDHLKTFERYRIHCNDVSKTNKKPDTDPEDLEGKFKGITDDNSYFFEIDTKDKKMIRLSTCNSDGEDFHYHFEIDAEAHTVKLWDVASDPNERTTPNQITIESRQPNPAVGTLPHGRITLQTADNCSIIMDNVDMTIKVPRNLKLHVDGVMETHVGQGIITECDGPVEHRYNNTYRWMVAGDVAINFLSKLGLRIVGLIQSIFDTTFSASIGVPGFNFDEKTGPKPGVVNIATTANVTHVINGALNTTITATESRTVNKPVVFTYNDSYMMTVLKNTVHNFTNYWMIGANWNVSYPILNALIGKINVGVTAPPPITVTALAGKMKSASPTKKEPTGTAKGDAPSATEPSGDALQISFVNGLKAEVGGGMLTNINGDAITVVEGIAQNDYKGAVVNNISGTEYNIISGDRLTDVDGNEIINANGLYEINAEGAVVHNFNKSYEVNSMGESTFNFNDKLTFNALSDTNVVIDGATNISGKGDIDVTMDGNLTVEANGNVVETFNGTVERTYTTDYTETVEGTTTVNYKQDRIDSYDGKYEILVKGDHSLKVEGNSNTEVTGSAEYTFNDTFTQNVTNDAEYTYGAKLTQTVEGDASFIHKALTTLESNELVTKITGTAKLIANIFDNVTSEIVDSSLSILNHLKGIAEPPWPPKGQAGTEEPSDPTE